MDRYHMRRSELAIKTEDEMIAVIKREKYLTIAMCDGAKPYLVSINYSFVPERKCFYFHCAKAGRKIDILSANPFVYGQVVEDLGYIEGECEYSYRSVSFEGKVRFLDDVPDKRRALESMIESYESDPEEGKREFINQSALDKVCIGEIQVLSMTGKESLPKKK